LPFGGRGGEQGCARRFQKKKKGGAVVEDRTDAWGPSVRKKRKEKEKKESGARVVAGWAGPLGCWSWAGSVRLLLSFFLVLFLFLFSVLCLF
jgi:hypothetical protein